MSNPSQVSPDQMMVEAMKQSMPALKTQAQFNAFMAAFDALRFTMNSIFEGDHAKAFQGRETLSKTFELAQKVTEVAEKLRDVPEAAGPSAATFVEPPVQFHEYDVQKQLLLELETIGTLDTLAAWYQESRSEIDKVVSQELRNVLLDAVRAKKLSFT